jgi:hypothetical protein
MQRVHKPFSPNDPGFPPPGRPLPDPAPSGCRVTAAGDGRGGYDAAGTASVTPAVGARCGVLARATCRPIVAMAMKAR